jgi:type I restriction enzyme S subunit
VTFYKSLIGLGKGILFRETEGGALNTIRLRISMTNLNNEFLPLPPRDEQDQIVRYLDWKVSQINRIINAKRKQIGLLGELKRAVVSEAVTRSGEGWETRFLSQVCSEQNIKNTGNVENNILSLSYGSIIRKKNMNSALIPTDFATWQIVDDGNIILRLTDLQNDQRSLRTGLVRERGIVTSAYTCLKAWDNPAYLQLVLHAYDVRKYFYGLGGGVRQSIGYKDIRYMEIPYPTRDKQDKIADFLDQQCANIDNITDKLTDEITLFTEYRTRLISDVVTGKLDVRDVIVPVFETINDAFKTDEEVAVE